MRLRASSVTIPALDPKLWWGGGGLVGVAGADGAGLGPRGYPCWGSLLPLQQELLCPELSGVQTPTCLPTSRLVPQSVAFATGLA